MSESEAIVSATEFAAIALLSIDGNVDEKQLKEIATLPGVKQAKSLAF